METTHVKAMQQLIEIINGHSNPWIYRGQAQASWRLESTLERACGEKLSSEFVSRWEAHSLEEFRSRFHLYDRENIHPKSLLEWLSIMQHYGVPTRLLDFTSSPYAALYFGLEAYDMVGRPDLALYGLNYSQLMDVSLRLIKESDNKFEGDRSSISGRRDEIFEETVDRFNRDILWVTEPQRLNARIDRQAGCFIVSGNKGSKISELIDMHEYKEVDKVKLLIPGEMAESIFALLRKANISGKSIYGDLGGLAKSLSVELKIYAP